MSTRTTGRSRLAVRYFDDRILLTESHAWAYFRVPTVSYEFTTPQERESLAINITVALVSTLMSSPVVVVGSRAEAVFHSQVPPQETAMPSRAAPARKIATSRRLAAGQLVWPSRVTGRRAAKVTPSGCRPATRPARRVRPYPPPR